MADGPVARHHGGEQPRVLQLQLYLPEFPATFSPCHPDVSAEVSRPLPGVTGGCLHRPAAWLPPAASHQRKRSVENRLTQETTPEGRPIVANPAGAVRPPATVHGGSRRTSRGLVSRRRVCRPACSAAAEACTLMLDLFAGRGGVGRAVGRRGVRVARWDTRESPLYDVTSPRNLCRIKRDIAQGRILCVMLAPPCSSWSTMRVISSAIRSAARPWGLDRSEFKPKTTAATG